MFDVQPFGSSCRCCAHFVSLCLHRHGAGQDEMLLLLPLTPEAFMAAHVEQLWRLLCIYVRHCSLVPVAGLSTRRTLAMTPFPRRVALPGGCLLLVVCRLRQGSLRAVPRLERRAQRRAGVLRCGRLCCGGGPRAGVAGGGLGRARVGLRLALLRLRFLE